MATATKARSTAKKATAKPKPAPEPEEEVSPKAARQARNAELMAQVVDMRADGKKWEEIAEELDIKPGKAMFLEMQAQVTPKTRITWKDDDELAEKVVAARDDELLSWGQIAARTGLSEGKLKRLFGTAVGERAFGHRIGKGGRFPSGMDKPEKPTSNGAGKATGATKKTAAGKLPPLASLKTTEQFAERLDGKNIKINRNGKETKVGVKAVKEFKDGTISFISDRGQSRSVKVEEVSIFRTNAG